MPVTDPGTGSAYDETAPVAVSIAYSRRSPRPSVNAHRPSGLTSRPRSDRLPTESQPPRRPLTSRPSEKSGELSGAGGKPPAGGRPAAGSRRKLLPTAASGSVVSTETAGEPEFVTVAR